MKFHIEVDYEDGTEIYQLTEMERFGLLLPVGIGINLNAAIRIAKKKRKELNSGIKGDIKE